VIEPGAGPHVHAVAVLAGERQLGRDMVEGRGGLVILEVAGDAFRAQPGIDSGRRSTMALVANRHCVRADQGKSVIMVANCRNRHVPPADRVAVLAIGSELAAVQVGVTLRALGRRLGEDHVGVTTGAIHGMVQAQQRVARLPVMIEFRLFADRLPGGGGMALIAAKLFQLAMRVGGTAADRFLRHRRSAA
jgi:hypothetical protein